MLLVAHLLVQRVQHALSGPVAVALMRQQHKAHAAAMPLERRVEAFTLQRVGAGVVVLLETSTQLSQLSSETVSIGPTRISPCKVMC